MQLIAGVSIERGETVTRQTLFDLVSRATGGTVAESDLDATVQSILSQSLPPSGAQLVPGKLWWDMTDQLMKVWVDEADSTGVSCWCAIGPDRFDIPVLAIEPVPFGAAVQLAGTGGRRVKLPSSPEALNAMGQGYRDWENARVIGFNNGGERINPTTAASGAWFPAAVQGFVWAWYPADKNLGGTWLASRGNSETDALLFAAAGSLTGPSGISNVRGALGPGPSELQAQAEAALVGAPFTVIALHGINNWARRPFAGPRLMKHTAD